MAQVTIIGLNTLGASFGLALRKSEQQLQVVGAERNPDLARSAQQSGAVERVERWAERACKDAALVIIAEPLSSVRVRLEETASALPPGCVVVTATSLMAPVLEWAKELLPDTVSFVAGHPILEPSKAEDAASAELFKRAQYCVAPAPTARSEAMDLVGGLIDLIGAQPFFLDPFEHDGLVTATHGLPQLLGPMLMSAASEASSWHDMRRVAGPLFARATVGLDVEPADIAAELWANRENLVRWIDAYRAKLDDLGSALQADDPQELTKILADAREARDKWLSDQHSGDWDKSMPEMPKVTLGDTLGNLIGVRGDRARPGDKRKRKAGEQG